MATIEDFAVIDPSTGKHVQERVYAALRAADKVVLLTLLSTREVPSPVPTDVEMLVRQTLHPEADDSMIIGGTERNTGRWITVHVLPDLAQPAEASMVTEPQSISEAS